MKVYILTRTSGRPNYFRENVESVKMQTYPNIEQIACADDDESFEYASKLVKNIIRVERRPKREEHDWRHSPYNLYCNELMEQIKEPGWVMFLDDDDMFTDRNAVSKIVSQIKTEDEFLVWKIKFPKAIIPGMSWGRAIIPGDIDANCYMFHSKYIWAAQWDEVKESDFRVAQKLSRLLPIKWIDEVLTKVNNQKALHGTIAGLGRREDK